MVPKVAKKGTSFKGAGQYYLHDKKARTSERVAFTQTHNLPTENPELALRFMAFTAMRQGELKLASGAAKTGRKLTQSVYTYSLAWHPDERPDQAEMIDAARETLKLLGLDEHEAVLVAHKDEPHPHIHVIANRVHPRTGKAATLSCDHLALSRWAEAYEKKQGQIRCEQRVENNAERRKRGGFVKDRTSLDTAAYRQWQQQRLKSAFDRRQIEKRNLDAYHGGQRQALYDEKERRLTDLREDVRAAFRPQWAALYRRQRAEQRALERARGSAFSRLRYWAQNRDRRERDFLSGAVKAFLGRERFERKLQDRHEAERRQLAGQVKQRTLEGVRHENRHYKQELEQIKRLQAGERQTLSQAHTKESQDLARKIADGSDREEFRKEAERDGPPSAREEFQKRVGNRIRKAKKRDERGKGHGRERDE